MHTIHNDDCFNVFEKMIKENEKVDMVLVDLPYGTTSCKWDKKIDLEKMWVCINKILKKGKAAVFTASQPFTTELISSNIKNFKYCLVWEKNRATNFPNANKQPLKAHEDIIVFINGPSFYYPQMKKYCKPTNRAKISKSAEIYKGNTVRDYRGGSTERYPRSVLKFGTERGKHPTQKPVALMEYLIKTYSNTGETILDFTAGSGTTGIAAIKSKRKCILVEKEKKYFDLIMERIENPADEIEKLKNRPQGLKYKKSELKRKNNEKLLRKLVYENFKLTNLELANKLGISEMEFYRSGFGEIAKELKKEYKQQSLF